MLKKFSNYVNESISDIFTVTYTYTDKVRSSLTDIIMDENRISEKDFKRVDVVLANAKELFKTNDTVKQIIEEGEKEGKRHKYVAEEIFHKIIKNNNVK
jgi:hypothetical protein